MPRTASILALLVLLAGAARADEPTPEPTPDARADWIGTWAVFDGPVELVNVVVLEDGRASTTRVNPETGSPDVGTWQATPTALYLRYARGRGETIVRHGIDHRHVVRVELEDGSLETRVGSAFRLSSPFADRAGAWKAAPGSGEGPLLLRSDGTAKRLGAPSSSGVWRPAAGGIAIRFADGEAELVDLGDPARRLLPRAPAKVRKGED